MLNESPTRDSLELEKLKAEIDQLRRPEHKRLAFWISVATALVAVFGVLGQSYLSRIEVANAELNSKEVMQEANSMVEEASNKTQKLEELATKAKSDYERTRAEHSKILTELQQTVRAFQIIQKELQNLTDLLRQARPHVPSAKQTEIDDILRSIEDNKLQEAVCPGPGCPA